MENPNIFCADCTIEKFEGVAVEEGTRIGFGINYLSFQECKDKCNANSECQSFRHCPNEAEYGKNCFLYDKTLLGTEESVRRPDKCYTAYRQCQDGTFKMVYSTK